jgi:hypothetical protein
MDTSMNAKNYRLALLSPLFALVVGCSQAPLPKLDYEPMPSLECKFQMGDKNVEGAIVQLHSKSGKTPKIVSYYDSESDSYKFTTQLEGAKPIGGVPEGEYTVTVKPGRTTKARFSTKYADVATSGLTLQVESGENSPEPFELTP